MTEQTQQTNLHTITRSNTQPLFLRRLERLGFDGYGYFDPTSFKETDLYKKHSHTLALLENSKRDVTYADGDETDTNDEWHINSKTKAELIIRPFYWGDLPVIAQKDNLSYPALDLTIDWYKYALRAASSSQPLTTELINHLFDTVEHTLIKGE